MSTKVKVSYYQNRLERGQSLVFVAIVLVGMFGILALAVDGGMTYSNRRSAQNAADAGALAGARELCAGNDGMVLTRATEYTEGRNKATGGDYEINWANKVITVTAEIEYDTFFAGLFGQDVLTAAATAVAGCHIPCTATNILPVAWMCYPPEGEDAPGEWLGNEENLCNIDQDDDFGTYPADPDDPGTLYIVMTSWSLADTECQDPATGLPEDGLDCDTNNDGKIDVLTGGVRGWLNFDGSGSTPALRSWIENGYQGELKYHAWFPYETGVVSNLFDSIKLHEPPEAGPVFLPVVTSFYETGVWQDIMNVPAPGYHPWDTIVGITGNTTYYHVLTYSPFKVTCVGEKKDDYYRCPARQAFFIDNEWKDNVSIQTVEGYFVKDWQPDVSGSCGTGSSMGVYTLYLNR
jgi:hypothetical protein